MNIESILLPDEKILYRGVAVSEKGSKSIFGLTIGIFFCIMIILIINDKIDEIMLYDSYNLIVITTTIFFVLGLFIHGIIYNLFLKKRVTQEQEYFITNQRAIVYSKKKNEFKIGFLSRFDEFRIDNEKNNYGDVYMGIIIERSGNDIQDLSTISNHMLYQDINNMPVIIFESIENPSKILELAKSQRISLVPDKPLKNIKVEGETVKLGDQKIILPHNMPLWTYIFLGAFIIFFLYFPVSNITKSLKVLNNYTKTTATITSIEIENTSSEIYFVNVSYQINNDSYESVITNDICYLKSTQNFKGFTSFCPNYESYFKSMNEEDNITIYVNPNKLNEVEYIPSLISNSSLIFLIFGLICSLPLVAKIKSLVFKSKSN